MEETIFLPFGAESVCELFWKGAITRDTDREREEDELMHGKKPKHITQALK